MMGADSIQFTINPGALTFPDPIETARENARQLGLGERAAFVACDFGAALGGGLDLVVTNPPYIASTVIATLGWWRPNLLSLIASARFTKTSPAA